MFKHIPNILTLIRLVVSPLVLPFLIVYLRPYNIELVNIVLALSFVGMNLTDFFDGYLARKYHYETKMGTMLDPIADKFLLFSNLIALVAIHKIYFYWAIVFIGREFFIMGLRIIALEYGFSIPVGKLGKYKTFVLAGYITAVLLNPGLLGGFSVIFNAVENILLIISLILSVVSAFVYVRLFIRTFSQS